MVGHALCRHCYSQKKKERELRKKQKRKERKENNIPRLKKQADAVFSLWIRNRDNWTCQTCGKKLDKTNAQCSHFISRQNMATRYEPKNCICQCAKENMFQEGNKPLFALYLIEKYGEGIIQELVKKSQEVVKADANFFKEVIHRYTIDK